MLVILFTAPLGAIGIALAGPAWLTQDDVSTSVVVTSVTAPLDSSVEEKVDAGMPIPLPDSAESDQQVGVERVRPQ